MKYFFDIIITKMGLKASCFEIGKVRKSVILFYLVGTFGFVIPSSFVFFKHLTSFALLFNFVLISIFHEDWKSRKQWLVFSCIYLLGLVVEILGVQTKVIFGDYWYGDALGIKVCGTPLLIGLNWLFLVYVSSSLCLRYKIHTVLKIVFASVVMLLYDLLLEQIAPQMGLWFWKDGIIPIQNYIVWFMLALLFNILVVVFEVNTENKLAKTVLLCQTLFFLSVFFRFKLL